MEEMQLICKKVLPWVFFEFFLQYGPEGAGNVFLSGLFFLFILIIMNYIRN